MSEGLSVLLLLVKIAGVLTFIALGAAFLWSLLEANHRIADAPEQDVHVPHQPSFRRVK